MDNDDEQHQPKPETETTGAGGGRRIKTAVGLGDNDDGGWYIPRQPRDESGKNEPIRHGSLKDIAIEVLASSSSRDAQDIYNRLLSIFPEFDLAKEGLSDALARMVMSAYTIAQYVPDAFVFEELRLCCPYFSDKQIVRIIELALRNKPVSR